MNPLSAKEICILHIIFFCSSPQDIREIVIQQTVYLSKDSVGQGKSLNNLLLLHRIALFLKIVLENAIYFCI